MRFPPWRVRRTKSSKAAQDKRIGLRVPGPIRNEPVKMPATRLWQCCALLPEIIQFTFGRLPCNRSLELFILQVAGID